MEALQKTEFLSMLVNALAKPPRTPILRKPDKYGLEYK